jgi:EmrB/QacA subfamily drug resistance transporter
MISFVRPPSDTAVIRAAAETPGCASRAKRWVLLATILGSSVAFLEASVINVALPAIQDALGASVSTMQWIASAYTLLLAALTLVGGGAGDRFGRLRLFRWGTVLLAAASVACGLASSPSQLIAGRALQGVGAAMLVPNSLALLSGSFPKAERGRVIGIWSAATSLAGSGSPILGGWLVDTVSWRAGFLSIVPLALAALFVTYRRVPEPPRQRHPPAVDWWGGVLATVALGGLVFAIISSGSSDVGTLALASSVMIGVLALLGLRMRETRSSSPMIPPDVFRSAAFCAANLLTLLLYFGITAVFFLLPFVLIQVHGYSATLTGAAYLPFGLILAVLSPWVGGLGDRLGMKPLLLAGSVVSAAGLALFALPSVGGSYWLTFFPPMAIVGLGMALTVAPLTATVMGSVASARGGIASAVNNTVARVGGLLAVAVIGVATLPLFAHALTRRLEPLAVAPSVRAALVEPRSFADARLPASIPDADRAPLERAIGEAFVESFRWLALISAACALLGAAAIWAIDVPAGATEGDALSTTCPHLDGLIAASPRTQGCEECLRSGDSWVHLRVCLSCGHVGCCDSSKNRHATAHFWGSRHPIVRSLEPGEDWRWCYVDETVV